MKRLFNRIKKLFALRNSKAYLNFLRKLGMRIGEGATIHSKPINVTIDLTRPWLIEIGKNVQITKGVKILTHGYDWSTMKATYGDVCGSSGKVCIGNNCFIGMGAIILKGSSIGDNVIVGAGSVVTGGTFPSYCVIAGNPARIICSLDEYREKRQMQQLNEAKELVGEYKKVYGVFPPKSVLSEFFWLFEERKELSERAFISQMKNMGNYELSLQRFIDSKPMFDGYDMFLNYCGKQD